MKVRILTIFPGLVESFLSNGIIERAKREKRLEIEVINLRDYVKNRHKAVDDYPYGGGAGMVMGPEAFFTFFQKNKDGGKVIYPSPQGRVFSHEMAKELSKEKSLTLICGHYEGIDERVIDQFVDVEISIGDFVVSGGELPSLLILDSILRLVDGVINRESAEDDSFGDGILDSPCYTRPREIEGEGVPEVLLGGNHKNIGEWRKRSKLLGTAFKRPDLLKNLDDDEKKLLRDEILEVLSEIEK